MISGGIEVYQFAWIPFKLQEKFEDDSSTKDGSCYATYGYLSTF